MIRAITIVLCILAIGSACPAAPSQEDVLRSINENIGGKVDPTKFFALMLFIAGVVMLLALLSQRRKREVVTAVLNHHGKLIRELLRGGHIRRSQLKQLKPIADAQSLRSRLVLLLCPSLLMRPRQARTTKLTTSNP